MGWNSAFMSTKTSCFNKVGLALSSMLVAPAQDVFWSFLPLCWLSLIVYQQLFNYLSLWKAHVSIWFHLVFFHHALGYTQCSLFLHVLEVCDYKYNLVWVFRIRDCWELFNEISLQKKRSSQTGNAALNPTTVLGKVIAQGIGERDPFLILPSVNALTQPLRIWVGIWISWTYWNNFIVETGILALISQTVPMLI